MEKLETEEGQGDWGKTESEEDRVYSDKQIEGEDEQDDNREDRYSLDHFTVDPASKSKDKIVIVKSACNLYRLFRWRSSCFSRLR